MMTTPGSVFLIADGSDSGLPVWQQTARTVSALLTALPPAATAGVFLLGSALHWAPGAWRPDLTLAPHQRGGSFLAPILGGLPRQPGICIVVGAGEVFDLQDWSRNGAAWGLVRVGEASLQAAGGSLVEVTPADLPHLLDYVQTVAAPPLAPLPALSGFVRHRWTLDPRGFPLVWIEPLRAYLHLFPVSRPQFEHYLCAAHPSGLGDAWYTDLLTLLPRSSPATVSAECLEQLFCAGLLPSEVLDYVQWQGADYALPTVDAWRTAYAWLEKQDVSAPPAEIEDHLAPLARRLWHTVLTMRQPRTLLDLSLMRGGFLEWAAGAAGAWVGMGKPRPAFHPTLHDPLRDAPLSPTSLTRRSKVFGLRLLRAAT